jgi:hypothetical protein
MKCGAEWNQPPVVRPENVTTFQRAPEVGQLIDFVGERSLLCGEKNRIDGACRNTSDDFEPQIRKMTRDASKETDLIGRARTATREHDGEVAALFFVPLRYFDEFRHAHKNTANSKKLPTGCLHLTQRAISS